MSDYSLHEIEYSGTTTDEWSAPNMEDFDTDDLGEIDDHFLLSASGFPPENYGDLDLPVVEPGGDLNENALQSAHGGAHSVEAIDGIDQDTVEAVKDRIENLSQDEFDADVGS